MIERVQFQSDYGSDALTISRDGSFVVFDLGTEDTHATFTFACSNRDGYRCLRQLIDALDRFGAQAALAKPPGDTPETS